MRRARAAMPQGLLGWYKKKMSQANTPSNEVQKRVLAAYSNYLLKEFPVAAK